jgi:hypothetical protein
VVVIVSPLSVIATRSEAILIPSSAVGPLVGGDSSSALAGCQVRRFRAIVCACRYALAGDVAAKTTVFARAGSAAILPLSEGGMSLSEEEI